MQAPEEVAPEDRVCCALLTSVMLLVQVSGGRSLGLNADSISQLRGLRQASHLTGWGTVWRMDG